MNIKKAITYSLLAHVRNTATLIRGPLDIFNPLIKRTLSKMNKDKIYGGKDLTEINKYSKKLYDIDFPIPVLRTILESINLELNNNGGFILYNDNSFAIANYTFTEFDESVRKRKLEVEKLEQLFQEFCGRSELKIKDSTSIFSFLEKNKLSLAKYLSHTEELNGDDYLVEVQFVNYFRNIPQVYELIKSLYLGSILAEYIEFKPTNTKMNVELLFDTNFIISLLDLNTPESTHTCTTLLKIVKQQGYILTILEETIEEIKFLLRKKADGLNKSFLVKQVYIEDIFNACERRGLSQSDLERIIDNLESTILGYGINKVQLSEEIKKDALESLDYLAYKQKRQTEISAKHDTFALFYVRQKRKNKNIIDFTDVNCWFVNNAISRGFKQQYNKLFQPEIIKADDLLSILWLSNPQVNKVISTNEIADIGLSSLISLTFTSSLPQTAIIKEFEDNIQKYAENEISIEDIVRIATRISDKQLSNIDELNQLANSDHIEFVKRLEEEAKLQEELEKKRVKSLSKIVERFEGELKKIEEERINLQNITKEKDETKAELEETKKALKKLEIDNKVKDWQSKSKLYCFLYGVLYITIAIYILVYNEQLLDNPIVILISTIASLFWTFISKILYDRIWNHSNIENYKKSLE